VASSAIPTLTIDSLDVAVSHDDSDKEELVNVGIAIVLAANEAQRMTIERVLPHKIAQETIKAVIYQFGKVQIKIPRRNGESLYVSPDASACKISWELPKRCVVGTNLRFLVNLQAAEQRLQQVQIWFTWDPAYRVEIHGQYRGIEIGQERANLPDIEPNETCELELMLRSGTASTVPIEMTVAFRTALSGSGEFKHVITCNFQNPFVAKIRYMDSSFQELGLQNLVVEPGSYLLVEIGLNNRLDCPVKIIAIEGSLSAIDAGELPVTFSPHEVFTFVGRAVQSGPAKIFVTYEEEVAGICVFELQTPPIEAKSLPVSYWIDAPTRAVRHEKFEVRVTIEKESSVRNELSLVTLRVETSPGFFIEGPTRKVIVVFSGQKSVIPIRFMPLGAGSTTLPTMVLTHTGPGRSYEPQKFSIPIVITYTT
jgi:hypothetical protein